MQFLSPLFLLGAAALAIPILLHLVQKERKEKIPFASLMLMPRSPLKQTRRRRLKHLLLLFLRCLGVLLLALAFARPVATGAWFDRINPLTARSLVVLLDNSLSMSRPDVWKRALEAAENKIRSLRDSDEGLLVLFSDSGEVASQWENDPLKLLETLRTTQPSFQSTSYLQGLRLAAEQFQGERNARKEICLITDLQRSGLSSTEGWKVPAEISVQVEDVGEESSNLYIDEVRLDRQVFGKQQSRPILVRLNSSPPAPAQGTAQLFVEGKLVDRQSFEIAENGSGQLTFQPFELKEGPSRGKILLEPADALPQDNAFYFVLERSLPKEVLVVSPSQGATFYLERALLAGDNLPFSVKTVRSLPARLSPAENPVLILDDLSRLPSLTPLKKFVSAGGGVIVALGAGTRPESLAPEWDEFLPARVESRQYVRASGKPFTSITRANWRHPVLNVFQDAQKSAVASAQFYGYWRVAPHPGSSVLASFDEGEPLLVEGPADSGRILLFASSLDASWSDFPLRAAYLPFWFRLVQYVSGWNPQPAAYRINQSIRPGGSAEGSWDVLDPTGKRLFGLEERDPGAIQLKTPGHYEIRENKGTDWAAANVPTAESDLTRIPAADLEAVLIPGQSRNDAGENGPTASAKEKQQSLWWLFLLAAAAVFCAESFVANRVRLRE